MEAELGLIGAVWMELGRFGDAESWNRNNRAYMWYAGPCSLSFCCMHAVQRRQRSRQRNWIKTHPFYYTPPPSTPFSFSFTQRYLTPSLSPLKNPLFFSLQKTCREEKRRREEEKKRVGGDKGEREEAEKVGSGTRGRGERGRPDGRKEGKDLSKGSSAWLKDSAQINKYMNQSL